MMKENKKKSLAFEISFYEGIIRHSPDFFEALSVLGDLYTRAGYYEKGLEIDKRLTRMRPNDGAVLYNLACSYSLLGDIDRSLEAIKRSLSLGYDELEYLQQDDDLRNLRQDARFQEYFSLIWKEFLKEQPKLRTQQIFKDE